MRNVSCNAMEAIRIAANLSCGISTYSGDRQSEVGNVWLFPGLFNIWQGLLGGRTLRSAIEQHGHLLQMVELCAGLNQNLMGLRCGPVFNVDNSSDVQTGRIDSVLPGRHYGVVYLYFLETGDVTHLDNPHAEI